MNLSGDPLVDPRVSAGAAPFRAVDLGSHDLFL
jgi:hypothetical protein